MPPAAAVVTAAAPTPGVDAALRRHLPEELDLAGCETCWQSSLDRSRIYCADRARFHKIAVAERESLPRRRDLRGELEALRRCEGIPGIPRALSFTDRGLVRVLTLERLRGVPLSQAEIGGLALLRVLCRLCCVVWRMAARGVSHNDLRPENILVSPAGEVSLIDFDQASTGGFARCLARGLLGLASGDDGVSNGIPAILRELLQARLSPRLIRFLRGRRNRRVLHVARRIPALPETAGRELQQLHAAWHIAARSNASSPGRDIPYYDMTFEGFCLPGERSWSERWGYLRHVTPYRDKRILELGCNLGLLSIFLLKDQGARAALAVDGDPEILDAGRLAARAFDVEPHFACVNFDRDPGWESELAAFRPDVVFALSVIEWLDDEARFLAFLGRFDEVVFEGHHSSAFETRRLRATGFGDVQLVDTSERGRPVLLCRKT